MSYDPTILANNINNVLKMKNISQKNMLENCNLNKNTISSMLSRKSFIKSDSLATIADHLNCSVDYLLGRTDNINISSPDITPAIASNRMEKELLDMFRQLDYEAQDDIFDFIKLKYEKCVKKEIEKSCMSTGIESDIA